MNSLLVMVNSEVRQAYENTLAGDFSYTNWLQSRLDSIPRLTITILGHRVASWRACGGAGMLLGMITFLGLTLMQGTSAVIPVLIILANLTAFGLLKRLSERLFGGTRLVLLEHLLVALIVTTLILAWVSTSILDSLDAWILSVNLLLAFGRIGCLLGGCCHGRASVVGVRYPWMVWKKAPKVYEQVRLIPVQGYESLLLASVFIIGLIIFFSPHTSGDVLAFFMACYGMGRFGLEFLRGDSRPYLLRLSEPQWMSLLLILGLMALPLLDNNVRSTQWLMLSSTALIAVLLFSFLGRYQLGRPPLCPLRKGDITELMDTIRTIRNDALSDLSNKHETSIYTKAHTSHDLYIELCLTLQSDTIKECYKFLVSNGRLDVGTARLIELIVRDVCGVHDNNKHLDADRNGIYSVTFESGPNSKIHQLPCSTTTFAGENNSSFISQIA